MKELLIKIPDEGFKHLYFGKDSWFAETKLLNLIVDAIAIGEKELELNINNKSKKKIVSIRDINQQIAKEMNEQNTTK